MFLLGFGCGLPFFLLGQTLVVWLRESGWLQGPLGLLGFLTFFYLFKFVWAPALDARAAPLFTRLGRRRSWLLLAQIFVGLGLLAMALVDPAHAAPLFLAAAALAAFAGATQDAMVDAYRIEIAPLEHQAALSATYTLGYRVGLQLVGGVLVLYLAEFFDWHIAYACMAAFMAIPIVTTLLMREPDDTRSDAMRQGFDLSRDLVQPFSEFFRRNGFAVALAILAFIGLYKLPDQMLGIAGAFYVDSGFSKVDIANVSKLFGVIMGIAGAFLGGAAVVLAGVRVPLLIAAIAVACSNLAFILMSLHPGELWSFVAAISADNLSQGFAGAVLTAFLSGLINRNYTATQYALFSSLANLPGKFVGTVGGYIVEASSYTMFFMVSTVSLLPTLALLAWLWRRGDVLPGPPKTQMKT
jgi:PAT family beta-lactamase induction signal transducer AmpG